MRVVLAFALLVLPFAGCLEAGSTAANTQALGETGSFALGYAYDGVSINPYDGFVFLDLDDATNKGTVVARGQLGGIYAKPKPCLQVRVCADDDHAVFDKKWLNVTVTGVQAGAYVHARGSFGEMDLPAVMMESAGWGWAFLDFNGKPVPTLRPDGLWRAHVMVVENGFRDNDDGKVWNAAKTAPFQPANAADAYSDPTDAEVHVVLDTGKPASEATPILVKRTRTANFLTDSQVYVEEFENPTVGGKATLSFEWRTTAPSSMRFSLLSPSGRYIFNGTASSVVLGSPPPPAPYATFDADELGAYIVRVSGTGAQVEYTASIEFEPRPATLNLWFETVNTGEKAVQEAKKWGYTAT